MHRYANHRGYVTTNTYNFKPEIQKIQDHKQLLAPSLRLECTQEFAEQRAKGEFKLGLSTFAFSISKKSKNEDQKFLQYFRESMDYFDRGMRTTRELNDQRTEMLIALMKYKIAEFSVDFLANQIPMPTPLINECISQAISVSEVYDVVANPELPKVHVDVRSFSYKKFGNLLRSENIHRNGINNIILPINNEYYLHVVQIFV